MNVYQRWFAVLPVLFLAVTGCKHSSPPQDAVDIRPLLTAYNEQMDELTKSTQQVADIFGSYEFKASPQQAVQELKKIESNLDSASQSFNSLSQPKNSAAAAVAQQLKAFNKETHDFIETTISGLHQDDSTRIVNASDAIVQSYKAMLNTQDTLSALDEKYGVNWIPASYSG